MGKTKPTTQVREAALGSEWGPTLTSIGKNVVQGTILLFMTLKTNFPPLISKPRLKVPNDTIITYVKVVLWKMRKHMEQPI